MGLFTFDETLLKDEGGMRLFPVQEYYRNQLWEHIHAEKMNSYLNPMRRTGRTTTMILKAINLGMFQQESLILVPKETAKRFYEILLDHYLNQLESWDIRKFISMVEYTGVESIRERSGEILVEDFHYLIGDYTLALRYATQKLYSSNLKELKEHLKTKGITV